MKNLGETIRSKLPPLVLNKISAEDSILLQPTAKPNYNTANFNDNFVNGSELKGGAEQVDALDDNFRLERDFSDNDLYSYHDKSNADRIDEWQAGWNVTNAIQVAFSFEIFS
jgi:hypothetical protein